MLKFKKIQFGFTIPELLIAIVLIVLIMAYVYPKYFSDSSQSENNTTLSTDDQTDGSQQATNIKRIP